LESMTVELGGSPAFPVNIGVNEVTAHYTSPAKDPLTIPENSIVKVDVGVHVDGYIADTAITLTLSPEYEELVSSAEEALLRATEALRPGVKVSEIGGLIERVIVRFGHRPIRNLMGHRIERYRLHTGKSIPNVSGIEGGVVEMGEVYAVEPFSTFQGAAGFVQDTAETYIFRYNREKKLRSRDAAELLDSIKQQHRFLPFASRWLRPTSSASSFDQAFMELVKERCVIPYRVLVEASGQPVSQAEHTVLVEKDGCRVIT
ncbi:MAG: type II methionyl aminopeptidase, partial [Candidatus Bathyarchaeia archaeon]